MRSPACKSLLLAVILVPASAAAQNYDTVQVKSQKVAEGIWMLTGAGGNIGLASGPDATFIIDDQFAPLSEKIIAAAKAVTPRPIKYLINTHWHGDHAGGNENFGNAGVLIIAHDNTRKRMTVDEFVAKFNMRSPPAPKAALPVVTFSDTLTLHLNGETIQVTHIRNAHTDGDAFIHFRNANVVHTGDVYVRYGYPFLDAVHAGSLLGTIAGVQDLLASTNATTKYIPGHGGLAERKDVEAYLTMLKTVRDRVLAQVRAKKTLDQVKAMKVLADLDATYGKGPITADEFVELAFKELSSK